MKLLTTTLAALALAGAGFAAELGDDGLHKSDWMEDTFKDLAEDLEEAAAQNKRLMVIVEQRGCIYCAKMHEEVFPDPKIDAYLRENFFVVQLNMFGDVEVTDFDGETLSEKDMIRKWGILFTPTLMFFGTETPDNLPASQAAVATMPGAFGKGTTYNMLTWVAESAYETHESFQKYHAERLAN